MKNNLIIYFILILTSSSSLYLFSQESFCGEFGNLDYYERGIATLILDDGNLLMLTLTSDGPIGNGDAILIKRSREGEELWRKYIGTPKEDYFNNMAFLGDGSIAIIGENYDYLSNNLDAIIINVTTEGEEVWRDEHGILERSESFYDLEPSSDGGVIVAGFTDGITGDGNDIYLVKYDSLGIVSWINQYGGPRSEVGVAISKGRDNGFVISCDKRVTSTLSNIYVFSVDENGEELWTKDITHEYNGGCKSMIQTKSGDYLIVGEAATSTSSSFDVFMVLIDVDGNLIWKKYDAASASGDAAFDLVELVNSSFLLTGYGFNEESGQTDIFLLQLDLNGDFIAKEYFGYDGYDISYDIILVEEFRYLITGSSFVVADNQIFVCEGDVPVQSDLTYSPNLNNQTTDKLFNIGKIENGRIELVLSIKNSESIKSCSIYDFKGVLINQVRFDDKQKQEVIFLNTKFLSGNYVIRVETFRGRFESQKVNIF